MSEVIDEKIVVEPHQSPVESQSETGFKSGDDASNSTKDVDAAWNFLSGHRDADNVASGADLAALRRKIDFHIVPIMFLCYMMQFMDKVILNYALVMGISKDLNLGPNDASNLATFLFTALLIFEIPNVYALQMFPAAKWLGANVVLWGVATACGAAATSYQAMLVSRIFLGIFEATIGPSLLLISSQWYTKSEQAPRFAIWYGGLGFSQIIGGAISYGFQHVAPGGALSGWRTMFLVLGCVTVLVGLLTVFFLPDTPMKARWLSDGEKVALLKHVSVNQTGIENKKFRPTEIVEALLDPQIYLLVVSVVLLSIGSGVITTYSTTLIRNLGYDPPHAALMTMPSGVISLAATVVSGFAVRIQSHRWAWLVGLLACGVLSGGLMRFLPTTNRAGILAAIYLINTITATLPIFYQWTASNTSGGTKRAFAAALVSAAFSVGNIVGPQTFRAKDAPEYRPAKITLLATEATCMVTTFSLFLYYVWQNKRRAGAAEASESEYMSKEVWANVTDRKNKRFRYVY
ncbi:allantoate permease [Podospora appendiculata]|uniref:Allantoate permease n=1 Tax=Podospora appendiculata TaxID=314037 RepID=A0AAE1CCV8_9PEZI|nr:allantoate permease [Podospora appendiculata]